MKNPSPGRIVLVSSLIVFICVLLCETAAYFIPWLNKSVFHFIFIPLASLVVSSLIFYSAVENFIYHKIRIIYRSIHGLRSGNQPLNDRMNMNSDIFSKVNDDMLVWAKDNNTEIDKLKKLAEYRKEFLGNVSHELKTPIMSIQGYLETLSDGGLTDERINQVYIDKALRNVERMVEIVNDLESISKLESGEFELNRTRFDICNLTKEVFDSLELQAASHHIKMNIRAECDLEQIVYADQKLIREVMINLLNNAIKYGIENGFVEIGFYEMGDQLLIEVADNGVGISSKHLTRVFERFFRAEKSRTRDAGGTGLGLAIVKHIIEAHGQTIRVTSVEGEGSVFSFTLMRNS